MSEPAGFPRVSVSPVMSIRSSISWKQRPILSPQSAIDCTTWSLAPESLAPVIAQVSNIAEVFPAIISMYSSSETSSLFSNSISIICPSATLLTISPMDLTRKTKTSASMSSDSAKISNATASIASPALIAVASSYATCTASNPLLMGS